MPQVKIIIAGSELALSDLKDRLRVQFFEIIASAASGNEILRNVSCFQPDFVITDYLLTDMNGMELAQAIEHLDICPTVILANSEQSEYIDELKGESLNIFCITKPLDTTVLNHTLASVVRLTRKIHYFEHKIEELEHKLEDRKLIDKAKGLLMEKFNMTEDQAYKQMRRKAMNLSKPLIEVAKSLVEMLTPSKNRDSK
ncbi:MAG: ANTAR domain-containing protein [Endomicrobia bacterium]|nr:ANTAR domain-containing protein [Endomicrobiia bacterium]